MSFEASPSATKPTARGLRADASLNMRPASDSLSKVLASAPMYPRTASVCRRLVRVVVRTVPLEGLERVFSSCQRSLSGSWRKTESDGSLGTITSSASISSGSADAVRSILGISGVGSSEDGSGRPVRPPVRRFERPREVAVLALTLMNPRLNLA
jgi:hypothetical protein